MPGATPAFSTNGGVHRPAFWASLMQAVEGRHWWMLTWAADRSFSYILKKVHILGSFKYWTEPWSMLSGWLKEQDILLTLQWGQGSPLRALSAASFERWSEGKYFIAIVAANIRSYLVLVRVCLYVSLAKTHSETNLNNQKSCTIINKVCPCKLSPFLTTGSWLYIYIMASYVAVLSWLSFVEICSMCCFMWLKNIFTIWTNKFRNGQFFN